MTATFTRTFSGQTHVSYIVFHACYYTFKRIIITTHLPSVCTVDKQRTDGIYTELDLTSPQSKEHNYENVTADPGYLNVLSDPGSAMSATDYEVPVATIDGRYTLSTPGVYEVPVDAKKEEESIEIVYASPKVPTGVLNALQTEAESSDYYTPIQAPSSGEGYVMMASVTVDMLSPSVLNKEESTL